MECDPQLRHVVASSSPNFGSFGPTPNCHSPGETSSRITGIGEEGAASVGESLESCAVESLEPKYGGNGFHCITLQPLTYPFWLKPFWLWLSSPPPQAAESYTEVEEEEQRSAVHARLGALPRPPHIYLPDWI